METPDQSVKVELIRRLEDAKLVFQARRGLPGHRVLEVHYSRSLHESCAKHGYAPALLGYEQLPGGWIMVVMEHLNLHAFTPLCHLGEKELRDIRKSIHTAVKAIVDVMHREGHVYGDIRDTNLLVAQTESDDLQVKLVDFDWGGKIGEARYPMLVNHVGVQRPADAQDGD